MSEDLKSLMGEAYHEGITVAEIETFFSNGKFANLSNGKYVDKSKYDRVESELNVLKESTKDYDTLKSENATLKAEKQDSSLRETLDKLGVSPSFFKYVKSDINDKVLVISNDEKKDKVAVENYLKDHPQFAKDSNHQGGGRKIVTTKVENQNNVEKDINATINDNFRRALGKKTAND